MNYLHKHNPIGDVDMIRILQRLDVGATIDEILEDLPLDNREEARELLDMIVLLDSARENIVPPREHLAHILEHLDDPLPEESHVEVKAGEQEKKVVFSTPYIPTVFNLQKYFFPLSTVAVVVLLVVSSRYFTSPPVGTDAVLFELGTGDTLDTFPDDTVPPAGNDAIPNFDRLVPEQKTGATAPSQDQRSTFSAENMSTAPQTSQKTLLVDESFETALAPLVKNESTDAYGVFPEDDFSVYLQAVEDLPIDNY